MPYKEHKEEIMRDTTLQTLSHYNNRHSSSVPSTPSLYNGKPSSATLRASSPEKRLRDGSPKSVYASMENGTRTRPKAPSVTGCKYETGMAQAYRRIPYSIGTDELERPKTMPKKFLNPEEEAKLSGDMRELYARLLPSKESDQRRANFIKKLHRILNERWPGNDIQVHVFGSSGNKLCTNDSDVDICVTTPSRLFDRMCTLAALLAEHGMERVVCVPNAKVPIVKFWDPALEVACDMNVNNTLALQNTKMILACVDIDERVRPLAMIIKHWTKQRILNDAALGGTLSSYAWICIILNFLQTRNPPILPLMQENIESKATISNGKYAAFNDDIERFRGYGKKNTETLGDLLFHFFRRYAYDFDYEKSVISVREGRLISKAGKDWPQPQKTRLCVEEPFTTERNLGNTADDFAFKGIHKELRAAFDHVANANLDACLQQYHFPPPEERIFEKQAAKPPPVLTRSRSQSQSSRGKGGHGNRGGRNHAGNHHSKSRRASSAASSNKFPLPYNGAPMYVERPGGSQDDAIHAQFEQFKLHRRLFDEMQALQRREYELRLQQAQNQLQAEIEIQASNQGNHVPHVPREQSRRLQSAAHGPLTAPLRGGQQFSPYMYPQVPGTPQPNIHTQPSSPSFRHAQPDLRRSIHRSSFGDGSASGNARSHSQPARPMQMNPIMQHAPPLPLNSQQLLHYQHARQQQHQQQQLHPDQLHRALENQGMYGYADHPGYMDPRRHPMQQAFEDNVSKEYVGYWINDSPPSHVYRDDMRPPRMPHAHEMYPRVRGVPPSFGRVRDVSRSPSPSPGLPFRDRASSMHSSASGHVGRQRFERVAGTVPLTRGPAIINGTDSYQVPESTPMVVSSSHATTVSEATSGSDETYETPVTAEMEPYINGTFEEGFAMDQAQHLYQGQAMLDRSRHPHSDPRIYQEPSSRRLANQAGQIVPQGPARPLERKQAPTRGLNIQFGEVDYARPQPQPEQTTSREAGRPSKQMSRIDPPPAPSSNGSHDKDSIPLPLLSPVREVRTPSPAGKRKAELEKVRANSHIKPTIGRMDLSIPSYADLLRAKKEKAARKQSPSNEPKTAANGVLSPKINGGRPSEVTPTASPNHVPQPPQNTPSSVSPRQIGLQPQVNGWQQQTSRRIKNRSRPDSGHFPGELLPANESERKGG